jgi:hypothetical protein
LRRRYSTISIWNTEVNMLSRCRPLVLAFAFAAAGCAPVPTQVYVPDVPAGQVVYSTCPFNTHIPVGVALGVHGVDARVSLGRHDGRTFVELRLDVPEGTTVVLQDGRITLETIDPPGMTRAEFPVVSLVDTPIVNGVSRAEGADAWRQPITAPLVGRRMQAGSRSFNRHFWLAAYVDTASADEFWLGLPAFTINATPVSLPRLHFRRRTAVAVALLNC